MRKHVAIALLACAPALLAACERTIESQQGAVDAGEIAKRPDAFYGKSVTVVADVESVHGTNAFTLDEDAAFAAPDVLVITKGEDAKQQVQADQEVTVQGTVRPLVVADMEREYDWFDPAKVDRQILDRFKDRPVIIAESVRPTSTEDMARRPTSPPAPPGQQPPPPAQQRQQPPQQYGDAPAPGGEAPAPTGDVPPPPPPPGP